MTDDPQGYRPAHALEESSGEAPAPTSATPIDAAELDRQRHAARVSVLAFAVSIAGSVTLGITYARGGQTQVEGIALFVALGGLGVALVIWGRHLLDTGPAREHRHPLGTSPAERQAFETSLDRDQAIGRRRLLWGMLAGAAGAFGVALLFPLRSLGPSPGQSLAASPWRRGLRLIDSQGRPVKASQVPLGGLVTVFPQGQPGSAQGQVALVRVDARSIRPRRGRRGWSPDGLLAYSKVCTHAGCPVSLYLADSHQLLCPCHQSSFDVLDGAEPVQGPAARPLPQLPLSVDADGYVVADGDLSDPIGPAWWDRPR